MINKSTAPSSKISPTLSAKALRLLNIDAPRLRRLWGYYRNPIRNDELISDSINDRPYRQAQEWGMPARITGSVSGIELFDSSSAGEVKRKEVVIENDIGWRVDAMVDFLFGKPVVINTEAPDPTRQTIIEQLLREIFTQNGGVVFSAASCANLVRFMDQWMCWSNYCLRMIATVLPILYHKIVRQVQINRLPLRRTIPPPAAPLPSDDNIADVSVTPKTTETLQSDLTNTGPSHPSPGDIVRLARLVRLEIVEPARSQPLLDPMDCTSATSFATVYQIDRDESTKISKQRWMAHLLGREVIQNPNYRTIVEHITPDGWQKYDDEQLVASGTNALGRLPLVHIQNLPNPLHFNGQGDVEPLMPVQDELNTRLSDRAHRITLTSLKMYLGKGIDNFTTLPIAPGQMWSTDNPDANVIEFGGDTNNPGEDTHIAEVREAMDKISGVSTCGSGCGARTYRASD